MTPTVEYKTQDAIAVAFSAYKINKGYIKDTARFSEPTNSTIFSNKDMVKFQFRPEFRPDDFKPFNTSKEDYEDPKKDQPKKKAIPKKLQGLVSNNFVKIDLKKKNYVRGTKKMTGQQYKRQEWKRKVNSKFGKSR